MTSNIFQFLIDFAGVLGKMASQIWNFLNDTITISGEEIPVWGLLGAGTILFAILVNIIKSIVL